MEYLAFYNNPTGIIIVLVIVLVLFGGQKIPEMMRGLGQGMREFKKATNEPDDDELRRDRERAKEEEEREREIRARVEAEMRREREQRESLKK